MVIRGHSSHSTHLGNQEHPRWLGHLTTYSSVLRFLTTFQQPIERQNLSQYSVISIGPISLFSWKSWHPCLMNLNTISKPSETCATPGSNIILPHHQCANPYGSTAQKESLRKQTKAKNELGCPIKLQSKILDVIGDPFNPAAVYVALASRQVKRIVIDGEVRLLSRPNWCSYARSSKAP